MACRNTVRNYAEDANYHIYNRGIDSREIFQDEQDYMTFLDLLKRHLSREEHKDKRGKVYETYAGRIELLSYCLTPNHFHLLFYLNNDPIAIPELIRKVAGAYTRYFNKKNNRIGTLFQGVYKSTQIVGDPNLLHTTRHIHRRPEDYYNWAFSSLNYYIGELKSDWVLPDRIYRLYDWGTYENYLNNHEEHKVRGLEMQGFLADN